jgi:hypothetical protein
MKTYLASAFSSFPEECGRRLYSIVSVSSSSRKASYNLNKESKAKKMKVPKTERKLSSSLERASACPIS